MNSVGTSFLIMFMFIALIPAAALANVIFLSRRKNTRRAWLLGAAVVSALVSYSLLTAVFTLPSDTMLQNTLFFGSILVIPALGLSVMLLAAYYCR